MQILISEFAKTLVVIISTKMFSKTYQRRKLGNPNFSIPKSEDSVIGVSPATEVDESNIRGEEQTQTLQENELAKPNFSSLKSKDSVIGVSPAMEVDETEIRGEEQTQTYQGNELGKPNFSSLKSKNSVIGVSPAMEVDESKIQGGEHAKTYQRNEVAKPNSSSLKLKDSVIGVSLAMEVYELKIRATAQTKTYQRKKLGNPNFSIPKSEDSVIRVSPAMEVDESNIRGGEHTQTYQRNELGNPNFSSLKSNDSVIGVSPAMEVDESKIRAKAPTKTYQRKKLRKPNFSSVKSKDLVTGVSPAMNADESEKGGEAQTQKIDELEKRGDAQTQTQSSENPSHSVPQSPPQKKTRDLPNLTECHSCGFKVDVCSGKSGLRTLYSEWRIVLLCYKCFSSVKSSKICSYCFSGTTTESFNCNKCRHSVHRSCFFTHKNVAPWSYSCLGSEFSVCVDCWIPKSIELSRRRLRIRKIKNAMVEKKGRVVLKKEGSRVLGDENLVRSIEDVANDANCVLENVEAAARAGGAAMKKAAVARKGVNLANNDLSLVANREEGGSLKLPPKSDPVNVVGGPPFNSLTMNSKSCCLLNRTYPICSVDSSCKTLNSRNASGCDDKDKVSNEDRVNEVSHKYLCEPSISIGSLNTGSSTDLNRLCLGGGSDRKTSPKDGECPAEFDILEIGEGLLKEGEGSSDRLINLNGVDGGLELDRKQSDSVLHGVERHSGRPDLYLLKYYRKRKSLKPKL